MVLHASINITNSSLSVLISFIQTGKHRTTNPHTALVSNHRLGLPGTIAHNAIGVLLRNFLVRRNRAGHNLSVLVVYRVLSAPSVRHGVGLCSTEIVLLWAPVAQVILGVIENLSRLLSVVIRGTLVARYDRSIIEEVKKPSAVLGQDDLLLGPLNSCRELGFVRFLELLASLYYLLAN